MSSELRRKQTYLIGMIGLTGGFSLAISGTSRTLVRVVSPPRLQKVSWSAVTCKTGQSSYLRQITLTNLYAFPSATLESTDFTNLGFQYPAQLPQGPLERCHNIRHPWTRALWLKLTIQVFCNFLKPSNYGKRRETNFLSINWPERNDISVGYVLLVPRGIYKSDSRGSEFVFTVSTGHRNRYLYSVSIATVFEDMFSILAFFGDEYIYATFILTAEQTFKVQNFRWTMFENIAAKLR